MRCKDGRKQRINYSKVVTIMSQVMKELNKSLKDQEY